MLGKIAVYVLVAFLILFLIGLLAKFVKLAIGFIIVGVFIAGVLAVLDKIL